MERGGVLLCLEMSSRGLYLLDLFYQAHECTCNLVVLSWDGSPFPVLLMIAWGEGMPGEIGNIQPTLSARVSHPDALRGVSSFSCRW